MSKKNIQISADGRYLQKTVNSSVPIWVAACCWLLAAFIFPMYKISFIIITAFFSLISALTAKILIPTKTKNVAIPFSSGNEKLDNAVFIIDNAVTTLSKYSEQLNNSHQETAVLIKETCDTLTFIRIEIIKEPEDVNKLRRLFDYYLPTELKLAEKYIEMNSTAKNGEYSISTFTTAEKAMSKMNDALKKLYDSLFADDAMDVETDITVLETMLKQDNLT